MYYIYKAIKKNKVLYIGKSTNIFKRMGHHKNNSKWWDKKTKIKIATIKNKTLMDIYELYLINKHTPKYNIQNNRNDNVDKIKSYPVFNKTYLQIKKEKKRIKLYKKNIKNFNKSLKQKIKKNKKISKEKIDKRSFKKEFDIYFRIAKKQIDRMLNHVKKADTKLKSIGVIPIVKRNKITPIFPEDIQKTSVALRVREKLNDYLKLKKWRIGYTTSISKKMNDEYSLLKNISSYQYGNKKADIVNTYIYLEDIKRYDLDLIKANHKKTEKQKKYLKLKKYFLEEIKRITRISEKNINKYKIKTKTKLKNIEEKRKNYLKKIYNNNKKIFIIYYPNKKDKKCKKKIGIKKLTTNIKEYSFINKGVCSLLLKKNKKEIILINPKKIKTIIGKKSYKRNFNNNSLLKKNKNYILLPEKFSNEVEEIIYRKALSKKNNIILNYNSNYNTKKTYKNIW